MKKKLVAMALVLGLLASVGGTLASTAGSQGDPIISLSYITGTYLPSLLSAAQDKISAGGDSAYQAADQALSEQATEYLKKAEEKTGSLSFSPSFTQSRMKRGDTLAGTTGTGFMLLAGSASVSFPSGAVVDVSTGKTVPSGSFLTASQRYLVAEDTAAVFTVTSDTAVTEYEGYYSFSPSSATDYNAIAGALREMGLFQGGDTGYGSGYMLENRPTRIEGLIMFLRLLGEEDQALACTASYPFTDVPAWCGRYVAYAYSKGYSNGISLKPGSAKFGGTNLLTAQEYMTLLLRSLGYSDGTGGDFTWDTALPRAQELGLLTAGEKSALSGAFYRAQVAYLSYYSLNAALKGTDQTLLQKLIAGHVFSSETAAAAMTKVTSPRIS